MGYQMGGSRSPIELGPTRKPCIHDYRYPIKGKRSFGNRGGQLKLVNLPPKISNILQVTQLITVFEVYDNEREALDSF